jgi:hypothetical protein
MRDAKVSESVRAYQRALLGNDPPPHGPAGPWKPVVMAVDGAEFLMAQWPDGSTASIRTAQALDRFRESMRRTAPQAFREAMAGVSSPSKREGNRAERRAKGRGR